MQQFARWMNLFRPRSCSRRLAQRQLRIRSRCGRAALRRAPTLGACHAWLVAGGATREARGRDPGMRRRAGAGPRTREGGRVAGVTAPPVLRTGESTGCWTGSRACCGQPGQRGRRGADNRPGSVAVLLKDADAVLAARPTGVDIDLGLAGLSRRAPRRRGGARFSRQRDRWRPGDRQPQRVAGRLAAAHRLTAPYVAGQGAVIGRRSQVRVGGRERGDLGRRPDGHADHRGSRSVTDADGRRGRRTSTARANLPGMSGTRRYPATG